MIDTEAVSRTQKLGQRGGVVRRSYSDRRVSHGTSFFTPTFLADVPERARVCSQEAFAPSVVLEPFDDFSLAMARVTLTPYGLQAGVFTNRFEPRLASVADLEVGGVIIGDEPTYRIDDMPYGGTKDSGQGREGIRYTREEMTEIREEMTEIRAPRSRSAILGTFSARRTLRCRSR
jgi:acyl-CoA reductase-like NAD-dependent aldehyde dehydrogenase